MKTNRLFFIPVLAACAAWMTGCETTTPSRAYHVAAYKPRNPSAVRVKVSTSTGTVYVMEGSRCLMAAQCCVGANGSTPPGHHSVIAKIKTKRSGSFGFTRDGRGADIHKGQSVAVGYPMANWVEFAPAYGFHEGFVWNQPHTHGCIRLHKEAAARLFALTRIGTPVDIAATQPEDATLGKTVQRIDQRNDPDPPTELLMSSRWFQDPQGPLLIEE
jgi:lipoprotein-anchoring transpeptidase ErfK/SrfK